MWPCTKSDEFCVVFSQYFFPKGVSGGALSRAVWRKKSNLVHNLVSKQHLHGRLMKILGKAFSAGLADLARNGQEAPW